MVLLELHNLEISRKQGEKTMIVSSGYRKNGFVPSPKKQTKNVREKPNEKNDKYNMKLLYPTVFIPRFA